MEVKVLIPGEGTESLLMNREDNVLMQGEACTVEAQAEATRTGFLWRRRSPLAGVGADARKMGRGHDSVVRRVCLILMGSH